MMLNQKDPLEQMLSNPMINGGVKNLVTSEHKRKNLTPSSEIYVD